MVAPVAAAVLAADVLVAVLAPGLDRRLCAAVVAGRPAGWTPAVVAVTDAGSPASMTVLACLGVVALLGAHRRALAVWLGIGAAVGGSLSPLVKTVVHRGRPAGHRLLEVSGWSFPSGHTLGSTIVPGLLAVVAGRLLTGRATRRAARVSAAVFAVAVGLSRVELGVHWPTDVVGAWAIGALAVSVATAVLPRRPVPVGQKSPPPPPPKSPPPPLS